MSTRLPRLRAGDRIGLVAPSGPLPPGQLAEGVAHLRSWGLEVVLGAHLNTRHAELGYLAGTDAERARDLHELWTRPDIRAVCCARGGYGGQRMATALDLTALRAAGNRLLIGSSDATLLHEHLAARFGFASLFAPMPVTDAFRTEPEVREHLRRALFEPAPVVLHGAPIGPVRPVRGSTVGGTASLLVSTVGTPLQVRPRPGSIALLEDVTESPYRLDRILTQLVQSGWFDSVAGIGIGSLHNCGEPAAVRAAVCSVLEPLGLPMLWGLEFGHAPGQHTVPLGTPTVLDPRAGTLTIEPALTA
ncbi:S66 peptidase family protein [Sciscionella marina]|uniref:S66 peptidase family protein n=1 Tax=Sciscionella marina TaxID=508770 RepID=UPI000375898C|nr:LD-carboxypeptidase [Sciscionella marina]